VSEPLNDEVLDGVPVLPGEPSGGSMFPVRKKRSLPVGLSGPAQTAAAAAGGVIAGAAMLGLVRRRQSKRAALARVRAPRRVGRTGKRSKHVGELVEVVGTRSLLVDIHLLGSPLGGR
jgi:hypothetical protein